MKRLSILSLLMANHSKRKRSNPVSVSSVKSSAQRSQSAGLVRIVAGSWRGRKIPVVQAPGLRPTGDRVRETLFNWLQMHVPGSRCLDLFAGSGALGLEAASRGAASVALVESSAHVSQQLQATLAEFGAGDHVTLHKCNAEQYLATAPAPFDLVFIDPPFEQQMQQRILELITPNFLLPGALVYIELPTSQNELLDNLPSALEPIKHKRFGDVSVILLRSNITA